MSTATSTPAPTVEVPADLVAEVARLRAAEKAIVAEKKAAEDALRAAMSRAGATVAIVDGQPAAEIATRVRRNADLARLEAEFKAAYDAVVGETRYAVLALVA